MSVIEVTKTKPYRPNQMDSIGNATYMLLRQFRFPVEYDDGLDTLVSQDSDRMDIDQLVAIMAKHAGIKTQIEEWKLEHWLINAKADAIMAFLEDVFNDKTTEWTGFRIVGSVGGTGRPIFHFQLFAKHPGSRTLVFTGPNALNVEV